MKRSIRLQLTLWYIGSISLLILLFSGIVFFSFKITLVNNVDQILQNIGKALDKQFSEYTLKDEHDLRSLYEPDDDEDELLIDKIDEEANELFFDSALHVQLRAFSQDSESVPQVLIKTATLHNVTLPFSQKALQSIRAESSFTETVTGMFTFPVRMLSRQIHDMDGRPYILQLALSLEEVQTALRELLIIFAVLFPLLLVILSLVGYLFMKRAFSPVRKMVTITKTITAEDLSLRLDPVESHDEIGELAETLNDMIARLERSFKQIRQFSGDVSHELKTPLAELKCNAEVALRKERTPKEYQIALHDVIEDTEQLQKIVEDLLFLARMDSQSLPLSFTTLELQNVFLEVFEHSHLLAKHKSLALEFQDIEPVYINGDSGLLKRLFSNLMLNAIQYTPSGGEITFSLHKQTTQAVFTVTDTGIGIPEECLPHIFDRFYRVEQSRSHETGGSGLGLAIVQKIAELHQGHISVHSTVGKGTTFRVCLPCAT